MDLQTLNLEDRNEEVEKGTGERIFYWRSWVAGHGK